MDNLFIVEKNGRKRKAIIVSCDYCGVNFLKAKRFIKKSEKNFCCREHAFNSKKNRVEVECAFCKTKFEKKPSQLNNSKSGLYFCCRKHKDLAQQIGGIVEIQPDHYGNNKYDYRTLAFNNYEHKCEICGWNEYEELLQVHHIDSNRNNNDILNLMIVCPTHHWGLTLKKAKLENRVWVYNK